MTRQVSRLLLGSLGAGYKITPDLEYKLLLGLNYGTGVRQQEIQGWIQALGNPVGGSANVANSQLFSETITHTLNWIKQITPKLNLNAIAGMSIGKHHSREVEFLGLNMI